MSGLILRRRSIFIPAPTILRRLWRDKAVLPGMNVGAMMGGNWLTPSAGSPTNYTTPGSYSFTIPTFNTLTVSVYGAGGSGGFSGGVSSAVSIPSPCGGAGVMGFVFTSSLPSQSLQRRARSRQVDVSAPRPVGTTTPGGAS